MMKTRQLGLLFLLLLPALAWSPAGPGTPRAPAPHGATPIAADLPFGIYNPPLRKVCEYNLVFFSREFLWRDGSFDPAPLDVARACGAQVGLRLHSNTSEITGDAGGLDLARFEERIDDFAGLLDPYVDAGTVVAHLTIDEPQHCVDWQGVCPEPAQVDQAAQISKSYWPTLATMVNTTAEYAMPYAWTFTDIVNLQFSYHRDALDLFVSDGLALLNSGAASQISWSMQAVDGGCDGYGDCAMTPSQVEEVGRAMCDTGVGFALIFVKFTYELVDEPMQQSINAVRVYCGDVPSYPPYAVPGGDRTVRDADGDGRETVVLDGSASYDTDGSIVSYTWEKAEIVVSTSAVLTQTFPVGAHPLFLTVTDGDGLISVNGVTVAVEGSVRLFAPLFLNQVAVPSGVAHPGGPWDQRPE